MAGGFLFCLETSEQSWEQVMVTKRPRKQVPWAPLALIGGGLLAFLSWASLELDLGEEGRLLCRLGLLAGLILVLLSGGYLLWQRQQSARGLVVRHDGGAWGGIILLLLLGMGASLWPWPRPYSWLGTLLVVGCVLGALGIALRLAGRGAPSELLRAQKAYQRGEHQRALAALEGLGAGEGESSYEGLWLQARIFREQGKYDQALRLAERLVALRPELYHGYAEKGLTLLAAGQTQEACQALQEATRVAPYLAEGHLNFGMACWEAEEPRETVQAMERALSLGLRDRISQVVAHYYLWQAFTALGQGERATAERRWLRRQQRVLRWWAEELAQKKQQEAEHALYRAILKVIQEE